MKTQKRNYTARLVVYGLPDMSKKELSRLEGWLNKLKNELYEKPQLYGKNFTARLMK